MTVSQRLAALALGLSIALLSAGCNWLAVGDAPDDGAAGGAEEEQGPDMAAPVSRADWSTYVDAKHGFRIGHPADFAVRAKAGAELDASGPTPVAWILFMNPTMAAGDLAGIEPADLELRVFRAAAAGSLEGWLEQAGLADGRSGARVEPYRAPGFEGLEVCTATLVAPGCSVFGLQGERVYQLTPASAAGEAMLATLELAP